MHELAIAQSILAAVESRVTSGRVKRLSLEIGMLSGVVPHALRFAFEACSVETVLEGAELEIVEVEGAGHCHDCERDVPLAELIPLCPCGSARVEIRRGEELRILEAEVV